MKINVLDNGYIKLEEVWGSDERIVVAARMSTSKGFKGWGTLENPGDEKLLSYLWKNRHTTPFEQCGLNFEVQAPIMVFREWHRHRTQCLAGDVELYFDLPSSKSRKYGANIFKRKIRDLHQLWTTGSICINKNPKKKLLYLEQVDLNCSYSISNLGKIVHRRKEDLRNYIRDGRLQAFKKDSKTYILGQAWHNYTEKESVVIVPMKDRIKHMQLRMCNETTGKIEHTNITDIWESGVKPTYKVTFENGYSIKCSKDHQFFTEKGWMALQNATELRLLKNNLVAWSKNTPKFATNGIAEPVVWNKGLSYKSKHTMSEEGKQAVRIARSGEKSNWWKGGVTKTRQSIAAWTTACAKDVHEKYNYKCVTCSSNNKLHAHHLDPVWHNLTRSKHFLNLITLCENCHKEIHNKNLEILLLNDFNFKNDLTTFFSRHPNNLLFNKPKPKVSPINIRLVVRYVSIVSVEYVGEEMTYDVSVNGPFHNFIANGIVTHNSYNEFSARYSQMPNLHYVPTSSRVHLQSKTNKQGTSEDESSTIIVSEFLDRIQKEQQQIYDTYQWALDQGIAREIARINTPVSRYSRMVASANLLNWLRFLGLRQAENAQWEIREYAKVIGSIIKEHFPRTYILFEEQKI